MKQIRKRLTYANVMSSIAVFLVLGGGAAFAATQLPKNSVGSPQIKKNAVKTGDIARNAVRVGKLAPEAAKAGKIAKNAIPTNRLRDGAVAEAKIGSGAVTGSKLGDGAVTGSKIGGGAVVASKLGPIVTHTATASIPAAELGTLQASCDPGEVLLGGGADWDRKGPDLLLQVAESSKLDEDTWRATGNNLAAGAVTFRVYAYCLAA